MLGSASKVKIGAVAVDVTSTDSIKKLASLLASKEGPLAEYGGRLDVLVNNAGVGAPPGRVDYNVNMFLPTQDTTADDLMYVMKTNVAAVVEITSEYPKIPWSSFRDTYSNSNFFETTSSRLCLSPSSLVLSTCLLLVVPCRSPKVFPRHGLVH